MVHDHDEPGLYNEACPLGQLATFPPSTSAPDAMPAPGSPPACKALVPSVWVAVLPTAVVPSAPRAPPALV
jgi:hypothetical protein